MFLRKFILFISHERRGRGAGKNLHNSHVGATGGSGKNRKQHPARHASPDNPCPDLRCKPKLKDTLPAGVTAGTSRKAMPPPPPLTGKLGDANKKLPTCA